MEQKLAKQINIFPADLRGIGEGSNMMEAGPGAVSQSRMTNGSVSPARFGLAHDERHSAETGAARPWWFGIRRRANDLRASRM